MATPDPWDVYLDGAKKPAPAVKPKAPPSAAASPSAPVVYRTAAALATSSAAEDEWGFSDPGKKRIWDVAPSKAIPTFGSRLLEQLNPIPALVAMREAGAADRAAEAEYRRVHPNAGYGEVTLNTAKINWGVFKAPYEIAKGIYQDAAAGNYGAAAGGAVGVAAPFLLGGAVKKFLPAKPVPPPGVAALTKAEGALSELRSTLPATPIEAGQEAVVRGARKTLSGHAAQIEANKTQAAKTVTSEYALHDQVLNAAEQPAGFVLKEGVKGKGRSWKVKPVIASHPVKAPLPLAEVRGNLEALVQAEDLRMLPEGHPIKTWLKKVTERDPKAKSGYKGNDYAEHDAFKKDLGELGRAVDSGISARVMGQINRAVEPVLSTELERMAKAQKIDPAAVLASKEAGDLAAAQKELALGKAPLNKKLQNKYYDEAVQRFPPVPEPKGVKQAYTSALQQAEDTWVKHSVASQTNLEGVLTALGGPKQATHVAAHIVDYTTKTRNWGFWDTIKPEVKAMLYPDPNVVTSIFKQLQEAEKLHGAAVTNGVVADTMKSLANTINSPVAEFVPYPGKGPVRLGITALSKFLNRPDAARRFNQSLKVNIARIPLKVRVARGMATAAQASAVNAPLTKAAEAIAPPPSDNSKMAGDQ